MVETTLYAVALALYTLLVQRGRLSFWDRLLVELVGQLAVEEVTSKVVDIVFRRAYVVVVSVNFLIGLLGGFWSMVTGDLIWALVGVAFFGPAFVSFLVVVEVWMPYATRRIVREIQEPKPKG